MKKQFLVFFSLFGVGIILSMVFGLRLKQSVKATSHAVVLNVSSSTGGTITSSPAGISCPGDCSESFPQSTTVTLTATASPGRLLSSWSTSPISCQGASTSAHYDTTCAITLSTAAGSSYAEVFWYWTTYTLTTTKKGSGSGKITSSTGQISCSTSCSNSLPRNKDGMNLIATPNAGSVFAGWGLPSEGGTQCSGGGKGGDTTSRSTANCFIRADGSVQNLGTEVAFFELATSTSAPSASPRTASPRTAASGSTKPAPINTADVKLNDQTLSQGQAKPSYGVDEGVVVSGKTIPNGVVKLYIFSEPRTAEVTADGNGNWSYNIENLAPGDHRVEAEVKDPATGLVSDRGVLAEFSVVAATSPLNKSASQVAVKQKSILPWIIVGVATALSVGVVAFYWFYWRARHQKHQKRSTTIVTPESSDDQSRHAKE